MNRILASPVVTTPSIILLVLLLVSLNVDLPVSNTGLDELPDSGTLNDAEVKIQLYP